MKIINSVDVSKYSKLRLNKLQNDRKKRYCDLKIKLSSYMA
jgi:hypothetical protein